MWIYFFHSFLAEFKTIFSCPIPELVNTYPPYLQNWLTYLLTHPTYITDLPTCTTFLTYSHRIHTWPCIQLQTSRQTDKQTDKGGMENSRIWRSIFYPIEKITSQLIIWKKVEYCGSWGYAARYRQLQIVINEVLLVLMLVASYS